jgi:hypothetical protein
MKRIAFALLLCPLWAVPASAQYNATPYPVQRMDFDLWCTEQQHLSWERCDKRLPEDLEKFDAYRAVVERYEVPYLEQKRQTLHFDETIMRHDPIDKKPNSLQAPVPQPID